MVGKSAKDDDGRGIRIGRILSELHERFGRGERVDDEVVLAEHGDIADELRPQLALLRQLKSDASTITYLVRQGILSPSDDDRYKALLAEFQIIGVIGRGGMGIVLKAFDERLRRFVAIKLLRNDLADHEESRTRFFREARAAAALSHPNIVAVFGIGESHGTQYIIMEYVDGLPLSHIIRERGPLSSEQCRSLFSQLLEGLAAAHQAGLIHRDIKSANLLLDEPWGDVRRSDGEEFHVLKIADFGLARIVNAQTRITLVNQPFGTPEFMSPEQARGDLDIDHRTDLYSAGIVLYEMLTGQTPFRAPSPTAVIRQILDRAPPDPRSIQPEADPMLSSLALRLIAKRRDDRLASANEAISIVRRNRPVHDRERWRRRAMLTIFGTAILALATMFAWALQRKSQGVASPNRILGVRVESGHILQVMLDGDASWKLLHSFPETAKVTSAVCADLDGHGDCVAAATLERPVEGDTVVGFDSSGRKRFGYNLDCKRQWPDCKPPKPFSCIQVLAHALNDQPGDELIVVASDIGEYPTRLTILDPRINPPKELGTYWNLGDICEEDDNGVKVQIVEDFFGQGRPAILAIGYNNKLDGFACDRHEFSQCWTRWDIVPAAMMLDPDEIMRLGECVGPPATDLIDIPRGGVYAYAFVDLASNVTASDVPGVSGERIPTLREQGNIIRANQPGGESLNGNDIRFNFCVESKAGADGIVLYLDKNLGMKFSAGAPSTHGRSDADWEALWIPVVQERTWLSPPSTRWPIGDTATEGTDW
ncbi:MAG: protein kinase [Phycisphaerales bacterium]|nr:protein kinase [Phycisphaerales bacterium]MCB9858666.1 protein kinase [Phycisphaerales bacterium]